MRVVVKHYRNAVWRVLGLALKVAMQGGLGRILLVRH